MLLLQYYFTLLNLIFLISNYIRKMFRCLVQINNRVPLLIKITMLEIF